MGFEKEDIFLLETASIKSLLKGIVNIRSHFKGRRVAAIVLEPFTRFSTLLSVWIGASKRIGCYRFLNEGVYLGNILTHRLVYNPPFAHVTNLFCSGKSFDLTGFSKTAPERVHSLPNFELP